MSIKINSTLWFLTIFCSALVVPVAAASEVPFTIQGGQIIVRAKIKNGIDVEAAVLTGSPYSYVNADMISRLKLPVKYTADGPVTGRNDRILFFSELSGVVVGDEKPVRLYIRNSADGNAMVSLVTLTKGIGREIALALGVDFFENRIVQIDFKAKVIRFPDAPPFDYKNPPPAPEGTVRSVHKMEWAVDVFYGKQLTLPVIADLVVDGIKVRGILDTGVPQPFLAAQSVAAQLSLPAPNKGMSSPTTIKSLKVGAVSFTDVPGFVVGKGTPPFDSQNDYALVIGLGVIQNLRLTFDWKKNTIVIEK